MDAKLIELIKLIINAASLRGLFLRPCADFTQFPQSFSESCYSGVLHSWQGEFSRLTQTLIILSLAIVLLACLLAPRLFGAGDERKLENTANTGTPMKNNKPLFGILTLTLGALVQAQAQYPFTNGLVAYYPFNGNANDASGTNNGTVFGATLTANRFGETNRAYYFDGQSKIVAGDQSLPLGSASRTVSLWINTHSNKPNSIPLKWGNNAASQGNWLNILGDQRVLMDFYNSGVFSTNLIVRSKWQHLVCSLESPTTARIYINGNLAGMGTVAANTTTSGNMLIGNSDGPDAASTGVVGEIDDVRIYNRALSDSEVQRLYVYESQTSADGVFQIVYGQFTWPAAKTDAELRGGHLATFRDQTEWNLALPLISQLNQDVWIGGYQPVGSPEPAGNWSWVTGEPWSFSLWWPGEPNQNQGINEDALMVGWGGAGWNDAPSSAEFSYVLELEPRVDLIKAVKPAFSNLRVGANYQLQLSSDLNVWANQSAPFTATNKSMTYPQYFDVDNWGTLFFRLQVAP